MILLELCTDKGCHFTLEGFQSLLMGTVGKNCVIKRRLISIVDLIRDIYLCLLFLYSVSFPFIITGWHFFC